MELYNGNKAVKAPTRNHWRKWLERNHAREKSVWLVIFRKTSKTRSIFYEEAVEEALCFGWIDSKGNKRDEESHYLYFARRNPKSKWSGINKSRVQKLIHNGLMQPAGQAMIDLAKKTGTWDALADAENAVIPADLQELFDRNKKACEYFNAFPPSSKRSILEWISNAKRAETRKKRIVETVTLASKNERANHYRK